jgi:hypothetical protein
MLVAKAQGRFDQEYTSAMEMLRPEIDAELQEVRDVLYELRGRYVKNCWCDAEDDAGHYVSCQRARALMERLAVPEVRP